MIHRQTIREPNFDSVLRPATPGLPAQLTIHLKIVLLARDPKTPSEFGAGIVSATEYLSRPGEEPHEGNVEDADGHLWECRSWYEAEFNRFRIRFKKIVEQTWNNQLILLPPDGSNFGAPISDAAFREFVSDRKVPAHIRCRLEVALVSSGNRAGFHAWIEAVRLKKCTAGGFHSFVIRITNEDVYFYRTTGTLRQVTAAHEVGHWLGRPVALTDPRRFRPEIDPDYGRTLSKRMAIMGAGSLVTAFEAEPFLLRAVRHTGLLSGWRVMHRINFERGDAPVSALQKRLFP